MKQILSALLFVAAVGLITWLAINFDGASTALIVGAIMGTLSAVPVILMLLRMGSAPDAPPAPVPPQPQPQRIIVLEPQRPALPAPVTVVDSTCRRIETAAPAGAILPGGSQQQRPQQQWPGQALASYPALPGPDRQEWLDEW